MVNFIEKYLVAVLIAWSVIAVGTVGLIGYLLYAAASFLLSHA